MQKKECNIYVYTEIFILKYNINSLKYPLICPYIEMIII